MKIKNTLGFKFILALMSLATISLVVESCKPAPACGTKKQKKARHKAIKKSTNFMTK